MKSAVSVFVKTAVMGTILWYLYNKGLLDFSRVAPVFSNYQMVFFAFLVLFINTFFGVYRWWILLAGQSIHLDFLETFKLTLIGMFFNTALPGAVSGDVVKGFYIVRRQPDKKGKSKAFATLLLDRILGLSALVFVAWFTMMLNLSHMLENSALKPLIGFISMLFAGVVVFYAFVLWDSKWARALNDLLKTLPKVGEIFSKIFEAVKCYDAQRGIIVKGFLASVLIHTAVVGLFIFLSTGVTGFEAVDWRNFFLLVPLGLLVTAIPVAPAGLGTGHAAFFGLFQLVGCTSGADLFTAFVAFQIVVSMVGGIFYIRYKHDHPTENLNENLNDNLSDARS